MTSRIAPARAFAVVLGCGDVGSAVAASLHAAGYSVVLVDEADPSWHRRGMAFTNAWYIGTAELDGEAACFCASLKSVPSVIARGMIAATTWSWWNVASALGPELLVDARGRKRRGPERLRGRLALTIGIGPNFAGGEDVDVAIDVPPGCKSARSAGPGASLLAAGAGTGAMDGAGSIVAEAFVGVEALRRGRFMTERRIGEVVRAGEVVGGVGSEAILAPTGGVLLGLPARGARVEAGDTLVEVDPSGEAHRCYGVRAEPRRLAERVLSALVVGADLGREGPLRPAVLVGAALGR